MTTNETKPSHILGQVFPSPWEHNDGKKYAVAGIRDIAQVELRLTGDMWCCKATRLFGGDREIASVSNVDPFIAVRSVAEAVRSALADDGIDVEIGS